MFARIKKSGKYQYLQIVENRKGSPSIRLRFGPHMREMVAGMILLKKDENIRGHVFCSFLALVLRKELDRRLERYGYCFEWADIKQDLKALQEVEIEENGKSLAIRTECLGTCGKIFQAVGVAIPPTIREL